ncbi:S-adenosyl-L-methionine-dependent methyltransferase, partial [Hesseltinella vesiculosa]
DTLQADKSQLKNELMKLAFTEEFRSTMNFSKLHNGRVLDVGCGAGSWCIEMAEAHPHLQVIGLDFVDMFPEPSMVPHNCQLIHRNLMEGLSEYFAPNSFDFIHIRSMSLELTAAQYEKVVSLCWELLKPNGTMELLELDMNLCSSGPATAQV